MNISVRLRPRSSLCSLPSSLAFFRISGKTRVASVLLNNTRMRMHAAAVLLLAGLVSSSLPAAAQAPPPAPSTQKPPTAFANVDPPTWMRIGVEYRGRLEGFTGGGFADDHEDLYWLNRFRVTARFSMKPWLSAAGTGAGLTRRRTQRHHHRRPVPRSARRTIGACGRRQL